MSKAKPTVLPGLILILVGVLIIIHKLDIYYIDFENLFPFIFLGIGLLLFTKVFRSEKKRGLVFPATIFFLVGLFFLSENSDFPLHFYNDEYFSVFLIIIGLAFVVQFIFQPKNLSLLIPGIVLLLIGFGLLGWIRDWLYFNDFNLYFRDFWPVALILLGILFIYSSIRKRTNPKPE